MLLKPFKIFTLQWHITDFCEMNCKHCYTDAKRRYEIPKEKFRLAFKNYINFLKYYNLEGKIYFSGGDPLLHKSFKEIIEETYKNNIRFAILGNYHQLNQKNIEFLKKHNIYFYQLSLEGTKKVHEDIRGQGTFDKTIRAINTLEKNGIETMVNMTLTNKNINEIIPLIKLLSKTKLSHFNFVRVTPMGKSKKEIKNLITPYNFKKILMDILKVEREIQKYNRKLQIGKKDHLWKLLYFKKNRLRIDLNEMAYGCGMGYRHLTVLSDGDILLCRKIEKKIGNILKDNLVALYQKNKIIRDILKNNLIKGCKKCKLKQVCRGCPSISYAINKNFNEKDPQCWI